MKLRIRKDECGRGFFIYDTESWEYLNVDGNFLPLPSGQNFFWPTKKEAKEFKKEFLKNHFCEWKPLPVDLRQKDKFIASCSGDHFLISSNNLHSFKFCPLCGKEIRWK